MTIKEFFGFTALPVAARVHCLHFSPKDLKKTEPGVALVYAISSVMTRMTDCEQIMLSFVIFSIKFCNRDLML